MKEPILTLLFCVGFMIFSLFIFINNYEIGAILLLIGIILSVITAGVAIGYDKEETKSKEEMGEWT